MPPTDDLISRIAGPRPLGYCRQCQETLYTDGLSRCPCCELAFDPRDPATYRTERMYLWWKFWLPAYLLAVGCGVLSYAVVMTTGQMGLALFFAVPVSMGAMLGYGVRISRWLFAPLAVMATLSVVMSLVTMNLAGIFCGMTLGVIFFVPVLFGVFAGYLLRAALGQSRWDQRWRLPMALLVLSPYVCETIENACFPFEGTVHEVRTGLTVDASPAAAWRSVMFYEEVEHQPSWFLRRVLPRPIRSEGGKQAVGDVVRCVYDRGELVKQISRREEGCLLAFEVIEQHLHFERDVTLLDGAFLIEPTPSGEARVVLSTRYRRHLRPEWLWRPIEERVVHALHDHVLEGMRRFAVEQAPYEPNYPPPREPLLLAGQPPTSHRPGWKGTPP